MLNSFSKNIKTLRKIQNITQQKLSEKIGVSRTTISAWENRISEPDLTTLTKIRDCLGTSYDELLDD